MTPRLFQTSQDRHPASRRAFTLIEIMLAVVIMALIASAAALSFAQPLRLARAQDAMQMVRSFDESSRQLAKRFGRPVALRFDLRAGTLERIEKRRVAMKTRLPHDCRVREIRTAARRESGGEPSIPCSALGITRTYAVRLTGPGFDRWLLASGLGGEMTPIQNESQLDAIFAATAVRNASPGGASGVDASPGDDAD